MQHAPDGTAGSPTVIPDIIARVSLLPHGMRSFRTGTRP